MSEPTYTARTWQDRNGRWRWKTLKDGKEIVRASDMGTAMLRLSGMSSRDKAIEQARLDMKWDQNGGVRETVLNPAREIERGTRAPGLYVVTTSAPGPNSEFVELEDQDGRGVGPEQSGAEWHQEGDYWTLGPFAAQAYLSADLRLSIDLATRSGISLEEALQAIRTAKVAVGRPCVVIYPRDGVQPIEIKNWLEQAFQQPGDEDRPGTKAYYVDGNPLINARIEISEGEGTDEQES